MYIISAKLTPGSKNKKIAEGNFFVFGARRQRSAFTVYNSKKTHPDEFCSFTVDPPMHCQHIGLPVKKFLTNEQNPSLISKLDNFFV